MLSVRQQKALSAMIVYPTQAEAARAAGVSPRALRGYLRDPAFIAAFEAETAGTLDAATSALKAAASDAVNALAEVMGDPGTAPQVRANAAGSILQYALKFTERADILERINHLESLLTAAEVS